MTGQQSALEAAKSLMDKGMSAADANVEVIRMMGFKLVHGKIGADTRKALMAGVKDGRLGRIAKDGLKPEVFFHPNSIWKAKDARNAEATASVRAIANCMVPASQLTPEDQASIFPAQ